MPELFFTEWAEAPPRWTTTVKVKIENQLAGCYRADLLPDEADFERRIRNLSGAHLEVLCLTARGYLNKQIAYMRGCTEGTVKSQQQEILKRLGLSSRTQAAVQFAIHCERVRSSLTDQGERDAVPFGPHLSQ